MDDESCQFDGDFLLDVNICEMLPNHLINQDFFP